MIKKFLVQIAFCIFCLFNISCGADKATAVNYGHRLGADAISCLPENSLQLYRAVLAGLQHEKKFKYAEFDVRETSSGELVVFHDANFDRMTIKRHDSKLENTPFKEVRKYCLKNGPEGSCFQIPTPEEVLEVSVEHRLSKPLMIEIKSISDAGKTNLLTLAEKYKGKLDINFIISEKRFGKMFNEQWCGEFSTYGFIVMQTFKPKNPTTNNLCKTHYPRATK